MAFSKLSVGEILSLLPNELNEKFVSVSCLNLLMTWIDINQFYRSLAVAEMKRRFNALNQAIVKRGLLLADFPFQVSLSDFREDACNIVQKKDEIEINGMKMILKFLRHFGADIEFLSCNFYGASEEQVFTVFTYITRHCSNLKKLYFGFLRHSLGYSLRNSFGHVTELLFSNCRLDNELCMLDLYFPRVREISFYDRNEFQCLNRVLVNYPRLRRMLIDPESMNIVCVALMQAVNPTATVSYLGTELNVMFLDLSNDL